MKKAFTAALVISLFGMFVLCHACGGKDAIDPELATMLDEYEALIDDYTSKFADAKSNPAELASISMKYGTEIQSWMSRYETRLKKLNAKEAKAVQARFEELNKKAMNMIK